MQAATWCTDTSRPATGHQDVTNTLDDILKEPELITTTARARIVLRHTTPGSPIAWPLLVIDSCPYAIYQAHGIAHAHVHSLCTAAPWYKIAPCCWQPYQLVLEAL